MVLNLFHPSLYSKAINKSILETNVENYIKYQIKFLFKLQKEIKVDYEEITDSNKIKEMFNYDKE